MSVIHICDFNIDRNIHDYYFCPESAYLQYDYQQPLFI